MKILRSTQSAVSGVATAGVLLAGCGGTGEGGPKAAEPDQTPRAEAPMAPGTIAMKDVEFVPQRLELQVGDTVTWRNDESLDHNVFAQKGAKFQSRAFGKGGTYSFTAKEAGTIDYVCTLHPGMVGRLIVTGR